MARKLFSIVLLLVIVAGSYALIQAPTAQAAVHIQKKCREPCADVFVSGDYICFYSNCSPGRCFYRCFPFDPTR